MDGTCILCTPKQGARCREGVPGDKTGKEAGELLETDVMQDCVSAFRNADGETLLHMAVNDPEAAEMLVASGADVNARNRFGATPLHYAASRGVVDSVRLLLQAGAEVDAADNWGVRPLHYAIKYPRVVRLLVEAGADLEQTGSRSMGPLALACVLGCRDTAAVLLQAGADAEAAARQLRKNRNKRARKCLESVLSRAAHGAGR